MNHHSLIVFAVVALHAASAASASGGADDARRLLPHRQRQGGALQPRSRRDRAAAVAGQSGAAARRHQSRQVPLRGRRQRDRARRSTRAASARSTASGRRPPKPRAMNRTFSESLRFPAVDKPVRVVAQEARREERVPRDLDVRRRSGRQVHRARRAAAGRPGRCIKLHEAGDPAKKLDLLILGDGYTAARARQVRARRAAAGRRAVRDVAVQGAAARHQRLGSRRRPSAQSGISRPSQGIHRRIAGRRDLRRVRFRALRPDVREPRVPRPRRERAVRRRRDPDQQRDLRRRRHLRPVQHRRRRQRVGAVPLRPRVRPSPRRRSPTSTTRRTWPTCRRRIASSRGSRTSRRCSIPRR